MSTEDLVIGVDGGGTTTVAWLCWADGSQAPSPLGRGKSGPCNPQSVGWDVAKQNIELAIDAAFRDAKRPKRSVRSTCIAMAGGDREIEKRELLQWAKDRRLARRIRVENDAMAVIAAGTKGMVGVALIAGTGSIAFGRDASGRTARAGGWGHLLGDEGSSYAISMAALRYLARTLDGRTATSALCGLLMDSLDVAKPSELVPAIYQKCSDRASIASLSPIVFAAAEHGDATASSILAQAAQDLADLVACVASKLSMSQGTYELALAGGALTNNDSLSELLVRHLAHSVRHPRSHVTVTQPVAGAVILAQ